MSRPVLWLLAAVLAALAAVGFGLSAFDRPTRLRVAYGPAEAPESRMLDAAAELFARDKLPVRIEAVRAASSAEAAAALDAGRADAAAVRSDVALPERGQTVVILAREVLVLLAPKPKAIGSVGDLDAKRVGLVLRAAEEDQRADRALLERALAQSRARAAIVPLSAQDAPGALKAGRVEALALVGVPSARATAGLVNAVDEGTADELAVVPVAGADAVAAEQPGFEAAILSKGALGSDLPGEDVTTLAVTRRLVMRADRPEASAGGLARGLFAGRARIAAVASSATLIEAPEKGRVGALPVHPGAFNYYENTEQTFFTRYGDWIYIGAMGASGVGSLIAVVVGRFSARGRREVNQLFHRLAALRRHAAEAEDRAALDGFAAEGNDLVAIMVSHGRRGRASEKAMLAFAIAYDVLRATVADRRLALAEGAAGSAAPAPQEARPARGALREARAAP